MPFWLFPLNSCILLTKHHKLLLPDVPCSNARPHVQELMPKPLALPSLRWPLAALENHGRTVALHLHASCFAQVRRRQRCTLVICTLVPTPFRDVFFSPMYFDSFQGNPEYSVFAYVFFDTILGNPKPSLLWQTKMPTKRRSKAILGFRTPNWYLVVVNAASLRAAQHQSPGKWCANISSMNFMLARSAGCHVVTLKHLYI